MGCSASSKAAVDKRSTRLLPHLPPRSQYPGTACQRCPRPAQTLFCLLACRQLAFTGDVSIRFCMGSEPGMTRTLKTPATFSVALPATMRQDQPRPAACSRACMDNTQMSLLSECGSHQSQSQPRAVKIRLPYRWSPSRSRSSTCPPQTRERAGPTVGCGSSTPFASWRLFTRSKATLCLLASVLSLRCGNAASAEQELCGSSTVRVESTHDLAVLHSPAQSNITRTPGCCEPTVSCSKRSRNHPCVHLAISMHGWSGGMNEESCLKGQLRQMLCPSLPGLVWKPLMLPAMQPLMRRAQHMSSDS